MSRRCVVRWWESVHHTGDVVESDLTESTLRDYVRFQTGLEPRPRGSTINERVAVAERALRNEFPDAPCQVAAGFHQPYWRWQRLRAAMESMGSCAARLMQMFEARVVPVCGDLGQEHQALLEKFLRVSVMDCDFG